MHGLNGDFYEIDFVPLMDQALQEAIKKYKLEHQEINRKLTGTYSNSKCLVYFWVSDRRNFKWHFYEPNKGFKYELTFYLEFVKKIKKKHYRFSAEINSIENLVLAYFKNINNDLVKYLEAPMNGDFSWHLEYCKGLKRRMRHAEFASSTKYTDSKERVILAEMFFNGTEGRDEAIEAYLKKHYPRGGLEFEKET